jgi:integrase
MTKALTTASVEKCKPDPQRRLEIPDARMPGLYLIVQTSGAKSWAVRYRHAGGSRKLTLGPWPAIDLANARQDAQQALLSVQRGGDPAREKKLAKKLARRRATEVTSNDFEGVVREYFKRHAMPKNRSWRQAARHLGLTTLKDGTLVAVKGGLVEKWGERKIGDISPLDIDDLLNSMVDRRRPVMANRRLAYVRKLFNWAIEPPRRLITANPCAGIKPPATETKRERVLSDSEIVKLWSATAFVSEPFGQVLRLCLLTGCRLNEVAGMIRDELSEDGATWSIPGARTKNKKPYVVPLSPLAREVLAAAKPIGKLMFSTNGRTPVSGWSNIKVRLDAAMKVEPWRLHDLRRTAATGMAELGIPPHIVEACLNHISGAKAGVAGVYNRAAYAPEKRAALERWAAHIEGLTSGKPAAKVVALRERGRR